MSDDWRFILCVFAIPPLRQGTILALASSLINGASEDLIDLIYNLIQQTLQATDDVHHNEAYIALRRILEKHAWFVSTRFVALIELLLSLKPPVHIEALRNRFECFNRLMVYALKANAGNAENVKDELNGLDKAVNVVLGQRTNERKQLLVSLAKSNLTRRRDDKTEKVTKSEELVRLYDLLLQNTTDWSDLVGSGRDRTPEEVVFLQECHLKSLAFPA